MEYLLHIAYNSDFKKGSAYTAEDKLLKQTRKVTIQNSLRARLSLTVDVVKQGSGTTNTGNVARTFFEKAETVSKITGLNKELIQRFHSILQVVSCGKMIDCPKFKDFCLQTAELCVELYGWYKMPPSVHKVLLHGSDIVRFFELPFGWFSEEPQEASNKIFRNARNKNSRMLDRKSTNADIMHSLLISSDPFISSIRIKERKSVKALSADAQNLLNDN